MKHGHDVIVVRNTRFLLAGPTCGKAALAQKLALLGAAVLDSDVVGAKIDPGWFKDNAWRSVGVAERDLRSAKVGVAFGRWLAYTKDGVAISNLWDQCFLRGVLFGFMDASGRSERQPEDLRTPSASWMAVQIRAHIGLRLASHVPAFAVFDDPSRPEAAPSYLNDEGWAELQDWFMSCRMSATPVDLAVREPPFPLFVRAPIQFFRADPVEIHRLSVIRSCGLESKGVPVTLAAKWIRHIMADAGRSAENVVWLAPGSSRATMAPRSNEQGDLLFGQTPDARTEQYFGDLRYYLSYERKHHESAATALLPAEAAFGYHLSSNRRKPLFLEDAVALQYPWLTRSVNDIFSDVEIPTYSEVSGVGGDVVK